MGLTLSSKLSFLQCDAGDWSNMVDVLSGQTPKIALACNWTVNLGIWLGLNGGAPLDANLVDFTASAIQSITLTVRTPGDDSTNLMAKTVSSFTTMTTAAWLGFTGWQAQFVFSDSETNIAAGNYHLGLLAITTGGAEIFLGQTTLTVVDGQVNTDAADPAPNPGAAISLSQADARYAPIALATALTGLEWAPLATDYIGGGSTKLDGLATAALAVGTMVAIDHATAGLQWYRLFTGTDATASPGVIRPADFNSSTNTKVWKIRS